MFELKLLFVVLTLPVVASPRMFHCMAAIYR